MAAYHLFKNYKLNLLGENGSALILVFLFCIISLRIAADPAEVDNPMWLWPKLNHKFLCLGALPIIGKLSIIVGLDPNQGLSINFLFKGIILRNFWIDSFIWISFSTASKKVNSTPEVTLTSLPLEL